MISNLQFQAFLAYARFRLKDRKEVTVLADNLVEECSLSRPFWDDLNRRWNQQRAGDFDYEPQMFVQMHERPGAPSEPSVIRFWRTS